MTARCTHDGITLTRLPPGDHRSGGQASDLRLLFKRARAQKWLLATRAIKAASPRLRSV